MKRPLVTLRAISADDLPVFFSHQADPEAYAMAAFGADDPNDQGAFLAKWSRILADEATTGRTILVGGVPAGYVSQFPLFGQASIGYWIGREFWGKGIATEAVRTFVESIPTRPLYARVAEDNIGSLRVLARCGFAHEGEALAFANARGHEIRELILVLRDGIAA